VKLIHGHVNLKLVWEVAIEDLNYDPLLVLCVEGLSEQLHPYKFIAYQCCKELLNAVNAKNKVNPILPKLIKHLREALNSNIESTCLHAVEVIRMISNLAQNNFSKFVKYFIQQINKLSNNM
jgi:hypothetical protein